MSVPTLVGGDVQVLLNFRKGTGAFQAITLQDVLTGNFDPEWVRDRIVIIGSTAPSVEDYFSVATASSVDKDSGFVYGLEIQAHATSQIISAVIDQRPLIKSWPDWIEYLWILGWGVVGISFGGVCAIATTFPFGGCHQCCWFDWDKLSCPHCWVVASICPSGGQFAP